MIVLQGKDGGDAGLFMMVWGRRGGMGRWEEVEACGGAVWLLV